MNLAELKSRLPEYAKDLRLNLESVLSEGGAPGLNQKQIAIVALASAIAARNQDLTQALTAFASQHLDAVELDGARAAAAVMAMNNIYYRFTHLVGDPEYATLRANLRMSIMAKPGIGKNDFELASLAVSAINGCGTCMSSHEKVVREHGIGIQAVQSVVRIAAVIHAVAVTLEQTAAASEALAA
ncbi:MAG TPA: carboxymuconolactone decarboxylase family protein [Gammaproteobacteria bacterium]|jgi:alkyl hydroperoxide reductase subunit D|nr:carboxymuconolactone decarboxylase family protein [Gammaproteobacteria bacterium]